MTNQKYVRRQERRGKLLLFVVLLAGLLLAVPGHLQAAAKPKLSAKKVTVKVGKTKTVKVLHAKKVKWKILSGKKHIKISKVNKAGKTIRIKGKSAGKAKIQAKVGKKKLICKVTVKKAKKNQGTSTEKEETQEEGTEVPEAGDKVNSIPGVGDFSFEMLRKLRKAGDKNVLISPDSILSALAMASAGAKGNTLDEMNTAMHTKTAMGLAEDLSALHTRLGKSENVSYKVADSIWSNAGKIEIKNDFIETNKKYFGANVFNVPFDDKAVKDINNWAAKNTDNMIPDIIQELNPEDRVILLNAICFKGSWEEPYYDSQVSKDTFKTEDGKKISVKMLNERSTGYTYLELAGGKGFIKHYKGGETAFFAFLPPEGESVDTYLGKISGSAFCSAYEKRKKVMLVSKLPMFTFDYEARLENPLKEMGMKQAFTDSADFSGMSDSPVKIDSVIHKTHIELDQEGTKAAAVTAVISKATSAPYGPKLKTVEIILDRPFVYGIMDIETATPLFVGVADSIK